MAEQSETLDLETWSSEDGGELEKLETDVKEMAQKIVEIRETLPSQLHNTLAAIFDDQRPVILTRFDCGSDEPGTSGEPVSDATTSLESGRDVLPERDHENAEKIVVTIQKISNNASAIPLLLKRLRDSMFRIIDKINSSNETIHPAFKRKRTN